VIRSIRLGHAPNCSSLGNVLNVLAWTQMAVGVVWVAAESWTARRRRPEPDGTETLVIDDPPALVRRDGTGSTPGAVSAPIEAHVQVTSACALPCPSCHIDPSPDGAHVPLATIEARFRALAERGVLRVAIGGGEALKHPEIVAIADAARRHGLNIGLTTSGIGLTAARAAELTAFQQVNVSLDGVGASFLRARGYDGAGRALDAIRLLADAGVRVGVNVVLDRHTFDDLDATADAAAEAGARDLQILRLKPAGRGIAGYLDRRLTPDQALAVWPRLRAIFERRPELTVRVDCSMVPFLAAHGVDPERMRRFAFLGCHGGDALVSVDPAGEEHPCSFVADAPTEAWRIGVTTEPCGSCAWRDICRGGCHAVARHLTGSLFAPDPECPVVVAAGVAA
jgi:MoaA/NifB/PqqE/SkfB family radical SAM enzyme